MHSLRRPVAAAISVFVLLGSGVMFVAAAQPSPSPTSLPEPTPTWHIPSPYPPRPSGFDFTTAESQGYTLRPGDAGPRSLGGNYRIGWRSPGCEDLYLEWVQYGGEHVGMWLFPETGEDYRYFFPGPGKLTISGCRDYVIRLEPAS